MHERTDWRNSFRFQALLPQFMICFYEKNLSLRDWDEHPDPFDWISTVQMESATQSQHNESLPCRILQERDCPDYFCGLKSLQSFVLASKFSESLLPLYSSFQISSGSVWMYCFVVAHAHSQTSVKASSVPALPGRQLTTRYRRCLSEKETQKCH